MFRRGQVRVDFFNRIPSLSKSGLELEYVHVEVRLSGSSWYWFSVETVYSSRLAINLQSVNSEASLTQRSVMNLIHPKMQDKVFRRTQLDEACMYAGALETRIDLLWEDMANAMPQGQLEKECQKMGLPQAPREMHPRAARPSKRRKALEESLVDTFKRVLP